MACCERRSQRVETVSPQAAVARPEQTLPPRTEAFAESHERGKSTHLDRCDVSVPDPVTGLPRITRAPGLLTDDLGTPWTEDQVRWCDFSRSEAGNR
jgi:hypothetical protein